MSDSVIVQFVGFEAQALVREYKFIVRRALDETSEFYPNNWERGIWRPACALSRRSEICSRRLHRELAAFGNHPPQAHYCISETDLDDYRSSHAPKAWGYPYKPRFRGTCRVAADLRLREKFPRGNGFEGPRWRLAGSGTERRASGERTRAHAEARAERRGTLRRKSPQQGQRPSLPRGVVASARSQ